MKLTKAAASVIAFVLVFAIIGELTASAANEGCNVGIGIVQVDGLILRTTPSESGYQYTFAKKGDYVVIVKWANNEWYEVIYKGNRGFMRAKSSLIKPADSMNYDVGYGEIVGEDVRLRESPDINSKILKVLSLESIVNVIGVYKEWYRVEYGEVTGYVRSDYIRVMITDQDVRSDLVLDAGTVESSSPMVDAPATTAPPKAKTVSYTDSTGELSFDASTKTGKLAELAMSLIGTKYVYGGSTPQGGFDCSGFVMYLYKQFEVDLPHGATSQSRQGTKIDRDSLKVGDIVFFGPGGGINHSGIYLGDGVFIHASSAGGNVKLNNLSDSYYKQNYRGAIRVF